jgi:hypothetical protein
LCESPQERRRIWLTDKVSETVAWGLLAVAASIGLVGVAYLIGRFIWQRVEPNDPDPGGRVSPPPHGGSIMRGPDESPDNAVDLLRILRGRRR